jgi:hypothetical protein
LQTTTANLSIANRILCPLCLTAFSEEAIDLDPPELTEEHIIPEELGGSLITLTCKKCKYTHGSKLDAHLIQMLRCHDTFAGFGKRPIRGNIEVAGIRVPADIDWKATIHKTTTFRLRQNEAQKLNQFRQTLTSGGVDKINLDLNFGFIPNSAYLAVLRIAYLAMFREVGYKYVRSPAAGVIRKLIASYPDPEADLGRIVAEAKNVSPPPAEPLQLFSVANDIAVLVLITLVADTKRYYCTLMPHPHLPPDRVLESLYEAATTVGTQFERTEPTRSA